MKYKLPLFIMLLIGSIPAFAQLKNANVKELGFMTGLWYQKIESGEFEEFWGTPIGDNMVSSFRYVKSGKVAFYEFVVIEQTDSVPVMKIRHFNRGSIGWEEKDKPFLLPLVKLQSGQADFQSLDKSVYLVYKQIDSQHMDAILEEKDKNGVMQKDIFNYILKH